MTWNPVSKPPASVSPMYAAVNGGAVSSLALHDPYFANVSLLLHGDGTNGSTTITDTSPTPKTVTSVGGAAISTAIKKYGTGSVAFSGTGQYLTVPNSSAFAMGSGDFAVEAWVYQTQNTGGGALFSGTNYQNIAGMNQFGSASNAGFNLALANGKPTCSIYQSGIDKTITAASAISLNAWNHVAMARVGPVMLLIVNWTVVAALVVSGSTDTTTRVLGIGADSTGSGRLFGYLDDIRITKGAGRYGPITPPASAWPDQS